VDEVRQKTQFTGFVYAVLSIIAKEYQTMPSLKRTETAAILATFIFAALFVFQVLLAAGVPLGRAAYGGHSDTLLPALRIMSAVSALIFLGAIWTVLARSGVLSTSKRAMGTTSWLIWVLVILFSLSLVANITSSSPWERFLMAPLAFVIVVCCLLVALRAKIE
jgi:hypothetical protein